MSLLPFEKIKREILIKKDATTNPDQGCIPEERSIPELINYGCVTINKPQGPTSHQISDYVQKILEIKKAGHPGTLDPNVTGCLPVILKDATKLTHSLLKAGKEYICLMYIHKKVSQAKIQKAMKMFIGKITQLPPIKSAVKRQERQREIYYLEILEIKGQNVLFKVGCEAGTYIRKLCLHPNTEIISKNSSILAKDFFINPDKIYSMNNKKINQKKPSEIQKFNFNGKLIKITMDSGISFIVTPEHKMLISTKEGYIMKQTKDLKSDYMVKSLKYPSPEINLAISDLLDYGYLVNQPKIKEKTKRAFIKKFGSIRNINKELKLDRKTFLKKSKNAIPISHIKKAGIYECTKRSIHSFKTEKGIKIEFKKLNKNLMYLIGLIASDGNNTKEKGTKRHTRLKFHNKNKILIKIFEDKYKLLFPNFNLTETKRKDGLIQLDTSNGFLATICASLGVKSPQKSSDLKKISHLDKKLIASFLKGYFDGDGTAYYKRKINNKGRYSRIDYFTISEINAKRIHQMLLKIGISSKIHKRKNNSYVIIINNLSSKKRFISKIGSNHPRKKEILRLIKNIKSHTEDQTYIGFHYKKYLKENEKSLKKLGGNLNRILNSNSPITKELYNKAKKFAKLPKEDEFCIEKIEKIEKIQYKGPVYDMTVPKTHNFLIETGFISSNCHDMD